jgi:hypothetical protein
MSEAAGGAFWHAIATVSLVEASHKFEFSFLNGILMVPPRRRVIFNCAGTCCAPQSVQRPFLMARLCQHY